MAAACKSTPACNLGLAWAWRMGAGHQTFGMAVRGCLAWCVGVQPTVQQQSAQGWSAAHLWCGFVTPTLHGACGESGTLNAAACIQRVVLTVADPWATGTATMDGFCGVTDARDAYLV